MELNYHHLRLFQVTAQLGQVARAAESLHLSQPAISKQIAGLERALGVPLFDRVGRRRRLSPAGEVAKAYADQIFGLSQDLHRALGDLQGLRRGRLLIGASTTVGEYLLPRAMGQFRQAHPDVELVLEIANTEQILERVVHHQVDLGFVGTRVQHDAVEVEPFTPDEVVVIAAPSHPLARKRSVTPTDLAGQPFIVREPGSATRATGEGAAARLGLQLTVAMALGSNDAMKEAVAAGLGLGLISQHAIQSELRAGELRIIHVRGWVGRRQLSIIYSRSRQLHGLARAFLESVRPKPAPAVKQVGGTLPGPVRRSRSPGASTKG